jgi:hypothetical protein
MTIKILLSETEDENIETAVEETLKDLKVTKYRILRTRKYFDKDLKMNVIEVIVKIIYVKII